MTEYADKEVQVCCNRWLKRERWLSSFYRTGAFFSAESETITFYRARMNNISVADALSLGP